MGGYFFTALFTISLPFHITFVQGIDMGIIPWAICIVLWLGLGAEFENKKMMEGLEHFISEITKTENLPFVIAGVVVFLLVSVYLVPGGNQWYRAYGY